MQDRHRIGPTRPKWSNARTLSASRARQHATEMRERLVARERFLGAQSTGGTRREGGIGILEQMPREHRDDTLAVADDATFGQHADTGHARGAGRLATHPAAVDHT